MTPNEVTNSPPSNAATAATKRELVLLLLVPGILSLINKLLLRYRQDVIGPTYQSIAFAIFTILWTVFAGIWIAWLLRTREPWWSRLCIAIPVAAVVSAMITLNYQAATGTLGDVWFP